ncbi:outer membrane protein [Legionella micdadei]|uniref:outer membrane protein n=1 Tax=Legionella micdadei TaxID=451 RepID=UPI0009EF73FD|nr:outer membrane beta-barrel protein [Legionella micdadei]ARH00611.1 hypothetical protein B6V88_09365 [Legionella micdadei]
MRIAFFSAMLLCSSLATAATPIDGLYGSLFGGYSYVPDNLDKLHDGIKFDHAVFDNGFNAGGRFGYQTNHWRYEGELTYIRTTVNSFRFGLFSNLLIDPIRVRDVSGQTNMVIGAANLYYDFPEMVPCIAPFLGAGIGYGWFNVNLHNDFSHRRNLLLNPNFLLNPGLFQNPLFQNRLHYSGSSGAFVYQGTAGLTYNFTENYALNLAYRYVGSSRISAYGKVLQGNLASVGVVYRFSEYNYK